MSNARLRLRAAGDLRDRDELQDRPGSALRELFAPLDILLTSGGDARLALDPVTGRNAYFCRPRPCADRPGFSSSTATTISQRAFDAAERARDVLMQVAIVDGLGHAFETRIEQLRHELKTHLALDGRNVELVFSASGTDAQLQALCLTRAMLGEALTTIIVAADQTGSGTIHTARGQHFGDSTPNGIAVARATPLDGIPESVASIALPLRDAQGELRPQAENDALVLDTIEHAAAGGRNVLLQVMDSSKLGWRLPSDQCLQDIAARWPGQVQVVVDACQMRLSRGRLAWYLDHGCMVLVTGSKYFTGPPFSGALLLPGALSEAIAAHDDVAPGLHDYSARSDWPQHWHSLRAQFPARPNFGQWLRWEAALEEFRGYYDVPADFRRTAIAELGSGIARIIAASPALRPLPPQQAPAGAGLDDDEFAMPTIFAFTVTRQGCALPLEDCKAVHRALAARGWLVGQPVGWRTEEGQSVAALRICIGARHVTESWSADADAARQNLQRLLDAVAAVVADIELLLRTQDQTDSPKVSHGI